MAVNPIANLIPDKLYFTSYNEPPGPDANIIFFLADEHLRYDNFYEDFGPLNLAVLYRFCQEVDDLIEDSGDKKVVIYTSMCAENRLNTAFLLASYLIITGNLTAEQAFTRIRAAEPPNFIGYRDASQGAPSYRLHLQDVLKSIEKAKEFQWLDFETFDPDDYEFYERVDNGDLNWIIPGRILSFCGPYHKDFIKANDDYHHNSPDRYFDYFKRHGVSTVIRLNKKSYYEESFIKAGFKHYDLFFPDGSVPSDKIVEKFIKIVDDADGAVAVHCKAGLGRTGTLIACWMMKNFKLRAPICMAWLRICRPGSVIGPQQTFLVDKEPVLLRMNQNRRPPPILLDSDSKPTNVDSPQSKAGLTGVKVLDETETNELGQTQGDRLLERKAKIQKDHQKSEETTPERALQSTNPGSSSNSNRNNNSKQGSSTSHHHSGPSTSAITPIKQLKLSYVPNNNGGNHNIPKTIRYLPLPQHNTYPQNKISLEITSPHSYGLRSLDCTRPNPTIIGITNISPAVPVATHTIPHKALRETPITKVTVHTNNMVRHHQYSKPTVMKSYSTSKGLTRPKPYVPQASTGVVKTSSATEFGRSLNQAFASINTSFSGGGVREAPKLDYTAGTRYDLRPRDKPKQYHRMSFLD